MGVRSVKDTIREARIKAGLTQEELSDGICSPRSLSRIENGQSGVSPSTFQALMEHAGASCERYPVFANREDFECFYALKHAHFYLDAWQLEPAYAELQRLKEKGWADNKLYYQEWLLLHCRLQRRSCCYDHRLCYDILLYALLVTRPQIDLSDFHSLLLSQNEIQLLTAMAHEALYLEDYALCRKICDQVVDQHLASGSFTAMEKDRMQAEAAIVRVKYLFALKDYESAYNIANTHRHQMAVNVDTAPLFELTFLAGLCLHYTGDPEGASALIKTAFYSAHAADSPYAALCLNYLVKEMNIHLTDYMRSLPDIPLTEYPIPEITETSMSDAANLSDGTYDIDSPDAYTLGSLLRDLRTEQKVPQQALCQGLCSKSTLSKIENCSLQPDIALAKALLQRLGVSDSIFTFWGDETEAQLYDLNSKILRKSLLNKETIEYYFTEMKNLLNQKDSLYTQNYLLSKAMCQESSYERIAGLLEALQFTLPDFEIHDIQRYRLSLTELTILNNIAHEYRHTDKTALCHLYYLQILTYIKSTKPDILMQANYVPYTNFMYCRSCYIQKLYNEILPMPHQLDVSIMKYRLSAYSGFLFFYAQALGECSCLEKIVLPAAHACSLNELLEHYKNAAVLKKYLLEDFGIMLSL